VIGVVDIAQVAVLLWLPLVRAMHDLHDLPLIWAMHDLHDLPLIWAMHDLHDLPLIWAMHVPVVQAPCTP
jgi:hypothetical protein